MERRAIEPDFSHPAEQPTPTTPKDDSESPLEEDSVHSNAIAEESSDHLPDGKSTTSVHEPPNQPMKFTPKRPDVFLWLAVNKDNGAESSKAHCFYLKEYQIDSDERSVTTPPPDDQHQLPPELPKQTPLRNLARYLTKLVNDYPVSLDECQLSDEEFTLLKAFVLRKYCKHADQM
jgi:hypothetical protein